jgi:hypothetical protein
MPKNGAAVRLHPALEPTPTSHSTNAQEGVETSIGQAVASAATTLSQAMMDYQQTGRLAPATKDAGGSRIAKVAELQLGHELGDRDFVDKARERGRYELRQCFTAEFYQLHTPAEVDQALSEIIDSVLEITARVVTDERALAH